MIRSLTLLTLWVLCGSAWASGGGATLYQFDPDTGNTSSVQRGAKYFMNYCSGCHSLRFLRYGRLAADNGIPLDILEKNLMFTAEKPGSHILSAIPEEASANWFGRTPPDLSLTARARSPSWIYSFLMSFYLDPSKPTGVDNLTLPGAAMPHVLGGLQGYQAVAHAEESAAAGAHGESHGPQLEVVVAGSLDADGYAKVVADLTNFLTYAAEPGKRRMASIGGKVLAYVFLLIVLTYLIKREYWKDVH